MITSQVTSRQGNITLDNRDVTLILKVVDVEFFIVMDGSSSKKYSGKFVTLMAQELQKKLSTLTPEQLIPATIKKNIETLLEESRRNIMYQCIPASLSILILAVMQEKLTLALWAGDCALAVKQRNGKLRWLTKPHTVLNQEIPQLKNNSHRHLLAHSMQSCKPTKLMGVCAFHFYQNIRLLLATDGWWSEGFTQNDLVRDDETLIEVQRR